MGLNVSRHRRQGVVNRISNSLRFLESRENPHIPKHHSSQASNNALFLSLSPTVTKTLKLYILKRQWFIPISIKASIPTLMHSSHLSAQSASPVLANSFHLHRANTTGLSYTHPTSLHIAHHAHSRTNGSQPAKQTLPRSSLPLSESNHKIDNSTLFYFLLG